MESEADIRLSPEDRARLEGWVAGRNTPQKLVWRARIVLMWAEGAGVTAIIRATGKTKRTAYRWRDRYIECGVAGLERDATRPGRKPPLTAVAIERVVNMTLNEKPPAGTHWSARKLAKAVGLSHSSVQRIWAAHGLKPHLTRTFKLSNDPKFCEKVQDIVGLYLDPPNRALVLSVDEKSQIQALDRTQPGLPPKKDCAGTMTHDYKRHGTTTVFAALDVGTGKSAARTSFGTPMRWPAPKRAGPAWTGRPSSRLTRRAWKRGWRACARTSSRRRIGPIRCGGRRSRSRGAANVPWESR